MMYFIRFPTHLVYDGVPFQLRPVFEYHVYDLYEFLAGQCSGRGPVEEIDKVVQQKIRACEKTNQYRLSF